MTITPPETPAKAPPPWEKNPDGTALLLSEVSDDKGEKKRIKLVYLRIVVRWLMQVESLHFPVAARDMHKALTGLAGLGLYLLEADGPARLVGAGDIFDTVIPSATRRTYSHGIGGGAGVVVPQKAIPYVATAGHAGALDFVLEVWGHEKAPISACDFQGWTATKLAIPCEQAAQLWGDAPESTQTEVSETRFKFSDEFLALCESRKGNNKGEVWTPEEKNVLWAAICAYPRGKRGLREHIASLLGLGSAEAVSTVVRDMKRPVKLAEVTKVQNGKKVA